MTIRRVGPRKVDCLTCGKPKCPRGRDPGAIAGQDMCNHGCEGYYQFPHPSQLFPGEPESEHMKLEPDFVVAALEIALEDSEKTAGGYADALNELETQLASGRVTCPNPDCDEGAEIYLAGPHETSMPGPMTRECSLCSGSGSVTVEKLWEMFQEARRMEMFWHNSSEVWKESGEGWKQRAEKAEAANVKLREALVIHGRHKALCAVTGGYDDQPCNCGLDEALEASDES